MRHMLFASLLAGFSPLLHADDMAFEAGSTPVDAVRFYDQGARVERPMSLDVAPGRHQLTIRDLSGQLDLDSLQLLGLPDSIRVLEVSPAGRLIKDNPSPRIRELETAIEEASRRIRDEQDALNVLQREASRLNVYQEMARRALSERTLRVEYEEGDLKATLTFLRERRDALQSRQRVHDAALRDLREQINELHRNLQEEQPGQRRVTDVRVIVEATENWRGSARLAYVVQDARWEPVYEARGRDDGLNLMVGARVTQNSGEDWKNVTLTFSTARPSLGAQAPGLGRQPLNFFTVDPDREIQLGMIMRNAALAEEVAASPQKVAPAGDGGSRVEQAGVNVVLAAEGRASISTGQRPSRVDILDYELASDVEWVCVPRLNPRVFKRLTAKNTTGHPLIAGETHLFHEGRFLGYATLKHRGIDEALNLSLGQDASMKVRRTRNDQRTKNFKEGTFSKTKTGTVSWTIELKNEGPESRTVTVMDHVPVSEVEGVEVELTDATTRPRTMRDDGIMSWQVTLEPGQSREIVVEYEMTVPGGMSMALPMQ